MPTTNPRITITLRPELHAILQRLSNATGNSQSAIVADLLEASTGVFERMIHTLEAAERMRAQGLAMPAEMQGSLQSAQARIEEQLGLLAEDFPEGCVSLLDQAEFVQRRSRKGGRGEDSARGGAPRSSGPLVGLSTPLSNRGVTPTRKGNVSRKQTGKGGV
jgi:predicted DNA-binding protein